MHFGIISPPVPGHLHPFGSLGRELICRGHQVTLVHMPDLEKRTADEGLRFLPIGASDHPLGSLPESLKQLGQLDGLAALRFTIQAVQKTTEMICRDAPAAIRDADIGFLLVDQTEPAGGTVAEHLGLPFVTICNALLLNRESRVPPPFTSWSFSEGPFARIRNWTGYAASDRITSPIRRVLAKYRKAWALSPHRHPEESFSRLAQISQQPAAFDFPRRSLPDSFHYAGPLRTSSGRAVPFPWDKLDGRPLIYASLGTLQNGKERVFRAFAEACAGLDVQLVISHGGGLNEAAVQALPGTALVVPYAPQLDVLARASLTLTHAGLNTVLDSLTFGVPLVTVPITYEQPAIASRVKWAGVGEVIPFAKVSVPRIREAVRTVLENPEYAKRARVIQESIRNSGGAGRAAEIIEGLMTR